MKKAILINTVDKTVTPVEVEGLHDMYKAMGVSLIQVGTYLENGDVVFVDEEGLYGSNREWFAIRGAHQPFIGNGLVVGTNHETGESVDAKSTVEEIEAVMKFLDFENTMKVAYGGSIWD